MAFFEDMFKGGNVVTGLAVGIGVAVVGPLITPVVGAVLRPAAKAVIKAGLLAYEAGREGMAQANEASGDIVAEARSELDESRVARAAANTNTGTASALPAKPQPASGQA
jgi:hypothetical protein